jgi:F-type H+-transporting ATPase subunit delta
MRNPRLAGRYAQSLMDFAKEQNQVDAVYEDMLGMSKMIQSSNELKQLLKSPIIKADKKTAIINALTQGKVSKISETFMALLTSKGRENILDEISAEYVTQYKASKNILIVELTTAEALSSEVIAAIQAKIGTQFPGATIEIITKVNPAIIGGFIVESNNKSFDASIARDLKDIHKQFMSNEFMPNIR